MASFNKVILVGNLTRDVEVKYLTSGTAVAELGMAVSRTWFDQKANEKREETTFVDVTLWGRQAEVAGEYLSKGRPVLIEGRLQLDTWDDRETGKKRQKLRVVGEQMQMLGSRGDGGNSGGGGGQQRQQRSSQSGGGSQDHYDGGGDDWAAGAPGLSEDDVPF